MLTIFSNISNRSTEAAIYTIDNTISKDIERFKEIILDSANLVCGTTMGILQHPLLKRDVNNPINPEFDYLIIEIGRASCRERV